jgi:hypothetical protein
MHGTNTSDGSSVTANCSGLPACNRMASKLTKVLQPESTSHILNRESDPEEKRQPLLNNRFTLKQSSVRCMLISGIATSSNFFFEITENKFTQPELRRCIPSVVVFNPVTAP